MQYIKRQIPVLYLVVPCYNEEEILVSTAKALARKLNSMAEVGLVRRKSKIIFVDDGSRDKTWNIIERLSRKVECVEGLKLAHNKGHQNAVLAGLMFARDNCDCAISLDADLQDDIEVLPKFIIEYMSGSEIVYGVRIDRTKDSVFKKNTAQYFYKMMEKLGTEIVYNHADYRLMSKTALETLSDYKEVNLFLRGIVPSIGYKSSVVNYIRKEREAGVSKYPLRKMISFAFEGISSFSDKPIKCISYLGLLISFLSVIGLLYALISYFTGNAVNGWTAIVASIWLLGGMQMFSIGVVGTYIGKIYSEVKQRPRYVVEINTMETNIQ